MVRDELQHRVFVRDERAFLAVTRPQQHTQRHRRLVVHVPTLREALFAGSLVVDLELGGFVDLARLEQHDGLERHHAGRRDWETQCAAAVLSGSSTVTYASSLPNTK